MPYIGWFRIRVKKSGHDLKEWSGHTPAEALAKCNRAAGYPDCTEENPQGKTTNAAGELLCPGLDDVTIKEIF